MTYSKSPTYRKCKGDETGDTCAADMKQIRKQITRTMTCSNSAANALELSKQDNTNDTCTADLEQIIIWLANNTVNKITDIMTCSKSTVNASGLCKRNDTYGVH